MNKYMSYLRSMSFNIRYDNAEDGENNWKYRKNMVASMLRFHHVDVAGLQEVLKNQMQDLEQLLPEYDWIGCGREDGNGCGEYAPIFFKKDCFISLNSGVFWLSETPDVPGSMGWDAACTRICTWAELQEKNTGKILFFFNTHLDHEGRAAMREGALLLKTKISELAQEKPVVLTGDFNNTENSETYHVLTAASGQTSCTETELRDSRYACSNPHHGPNFTFHDFEAAYHLFHKSMENEVEKRNFDQEKFSCIDYIFIRNNIKVLEHGIMADTWDGKYPSDHLPVIMDFAIA